MAKCSLCGGKIGFSLMRYQVPYGGVKYPICSDCYTTSVAKGQKFKYDENLKKLVIFSEGDIETRKLCQTCGHIFCYTTFDEQRNQFAKMNADWQRKSSFVSALAGNTATSTLQSMDARNEESKITDFNKCPKCGSINLKVLSKEEFEAEKAKQNSPAQTIVQQTTSGADELIKYKQLLDAGIITQEEFDAKKKQLLGL